jgi:hypothetical protein
VSYNVGSTLRELQRQLDSARATTAQLWREQHNLSSTLREYNVSSTLRELEPSAQLCVSNNLSSTLRELQPQLNSA